MLWTSRLINDQSVKRTSIPTRWAPTSYNRPITPISRVITYNSGYHLVTYLGVITPFKTDKGPTLHIHMWRQWVSWNQTFKDVLGFFRWATKITKNSSQTKLATLTASCYNQFLLRVFSFRLPGSRWSCWVGLATTGRWSCWDHKLRRMQWHGPCSLHPMLSPGVYFSEWDKVSDGKNRMTMEEWAWSNHPHPQKKETQVPLII